ncbi:hypothetical protein PTI98_011246 [Pleurotus ostreatus]|nr:hypothetical protein PTI98_011246 [Pleurotus ostreatus]
MCITFWTLEHPNYALILCTNRDEFLDRPTENAHWHSFGHRAGPGLRSDTVLSGRDELAGGTWFGINRTGRVALLTNVTEPPSGQKFYSRGHLVSTFLLSDSSHPLEDEVEKIIPRDVQFAGFNLLLLAPAAAQADGDSKRTVCYDAALVTNHGGGGAITSRPITPQERVCGGFSNGIDGQDGQEWPKVQHGIRSFKSLIEELTPECEESQLTDRLFQMLAWRSPQPVQHRSQLRETIHVAPISITLESAQGSNASHYATRLSTVLLVGRDGRVLFVERDIWTLEQNKVTRSEPPSQRVFRFQLEKEAAT